MPYERPDRRQSTESTTLSNELRNTFGFEALDLLRKSSALKTDRNVHPETANQRIAREAEELHRFLGDGDAIRAVLIIPDPFKSLLRRINSNGDAYSVYGRLSADDRDKVLLTLDIDRNGKPAYKISGK